MSNLWQRDITEEILMEASSKVEEQDEICLRLKLKKVLSDMEQLEKDEDDDLIDVYTSARELDRLRREEQELIKKINIVIDYDEEYPLSVDVRKVPLDIGAFQDRVLEHSDLMRRYFSRQPTDEYEWEYHDKCQALWIKLYDYQKSYWTDMA